MMTHGRNHLGLKAIGAAQQIIVLFFGVLLLGAQISTALAVEDSPPLEYAHPVYLLSSTSGVLVGGITRLNDPVFAWDESAGAGYRLEAVHTLQSDSQVRAGDLVRISAVDRAMYWSGLSGVDKVIVARNAENAGAFIVHSPDFPDGTPLKLSGRIQLELADHSGWIGPAIRNRWLELEQGANVGTFRVATSLPDVQSHPPEGALGDNVPSECEAKVLTSGNRPGLPSDPSKLLRAAIYRARGLGNAYASVQVLSQRRVRWRDLSFRVCASESIDNRRISGEMALTQLMFDVDSTRDPSSAYKWRFVQELGDSDGGYRLYYQLYLGSLPVFDATAIVDVQASNVVTGVLTSVIPMESDSSLISALSTNSISVAQAASIANNALATFKFSPQPTSDPLGLLRTPDGTYKKAFFFRSRPDVSSGPVSVTVDAQSGDTLSLERRTAEHAAPVGAAVVSVGAMGSSASRPVYVTCANGTVDCELSAEMPISAGSNNAQQERVAVWSSGNVVKLPHSTDFATVNDPSTRAADDAYYNVWEVINVLASKLGRCGYDNKCGVVRAEVRPTITDAAGHEPHVIYFGKSPDAPNFGSAELAVVAHEFVHLIVRETTDPVTGKSHVDHDDCSNWPGQPFMAIEESLADTLGLLISALDNGADVQDIFGAQTLGSLKRQFTLSGALPNAVPPTDLDAGITSGQFIDKWRTANFRLARRVSEMVTAPCTDNTRDQYKTARYFNMGVPNTVAARLIKLDPAQRPALWKSDASWRLFLAHVYLDAADDLHCSDETECDQLCTYKDSIITSIGRRAPYDRVRTQSAAEHAFAEVGIDKCELGP